jgi:hypothetical protein
MVVTGAEISLGIQALKSLLGIAKEAKDLTDPGAIRAKVSEMYGLILDAQVSAIDAREAHTAQVQRIRELEEEIARLKAWGHDKQRYELQKAGRGGAVVYGLKADRREGEPPHWLCANCYQRGEKSFLSVTAGRYQNAVWECGRCHTNFLVPGGVFPE